MHDNLTIAVEGRAWVFTESNINTDVMMPSAAFRLPLDQQVSLLFQPYRPGWVSEIQPGDVLIGGKNFGTGSSRPVAQLMKRAGIAALVADSINDLFYRNCVNYALPVMECPGASQTVHEGDLVRVDVRAGQLLNLRTGQVLAGSKMPDMLLEIIAAGGLFSQLRKAGYFD